MVCVFCVLFKLILKLKRFLEFSPRSFRVFIFVSRSRIYFNLIFMYSVRWQQRFTFFSRDILLLQYPLLEILFLTELPWHLCQKAIGYLGMNLFLTCLFHWSTCLSLCHYHTIWLYYILKLSVIVCPVLSTTWNQVGQFPGCSLASSSFTPQMHGLVFSMVSPLLRFLELFSWVPPSSLELWSAFYCLSLPDVQSATTLLGISLPALHPECASEQKLGPLQSSLHVSFSQGSQSWAACCPMPQNSHLKTFVSFSSFFMDGG